MICKTESHLISLSKEGFDNIMGAFKVQLMEENIKFLEKF